jgi:hypothetical protein
MDIYTTPTTDSTPECRRGGVPVFMEMEFFSISMDRFLSIEDRKCSLQIDPRRT